MQLYKRIFKEYMDTHNIKYVDHDDHRMEVRYTGENLDTIRIHVFFDKDGGNTVQFCCWNIKNYSGKKAHALLVCNELNKKFRWTKFYIDDDDDIRCEMDAQVDYGSVGEECTHLIRRMVGIIDDAYPIIMKLYWMDL